MFLLINAVNTASKYFEVLGDVTSMLSTGSYIQVLKSTGNNGIYKLASVAYSAGLTRLTTVEAIPSAVADGTIAGGVYELTFSDSAISGKTSLVIAPWATDTTTSMKFNGSASLNYGQYQQQNILRLLENFAASVAPTNPTIGQHWFDAANSVIKVYTATGWSSDVNLESGSLSFKDPQHPTANTKYFITAAEPAGKTASGVTLYPALNPTAGQAMFRIVDAAGVVYFEVDYNGKLVSLNPLNITATTDSTFLNSVSVNTGGGAASGLNVKNNVTLTTGDVIVDSGRSFKTATGGLITLTNTVTLKGVTPTNGVLIQASTTANLTQFGDTLVTFYVPISATSATVSSTLGVTGVATFGNRVDVAYVPTVGNDVTNKTYVDQTITTRRTENPAVVKAKVNIVAGGNLDYTVATLAGADAALYDPIATKVEVLVLDVDGTSPTNGYYINSEAVATVGIKEDGSIRIHNYFNTTRSFYVSITLIKV